MTLLPFSPTLREQLQQQLSAGLKAMQLTLSAEQCATLIQYLETLCVWNQRMNLTGHTDPQQMVSSHLLDSLSVMPFLRGNRVLDVGSGAGLPGIPLAIACPEKSLYLLDSRLKRTQFMRHVCAQCRLSNTEVIMARMEVFKSEQGFDTIVARAVAKVADLLRNTNALLSPGGQWALLKAQLSEQEAVAITYSYTATPVLVPGIEQVRQIVCVQPPAEQD